jgi:LynF/TruF/PatF family peptide O-prenyltransferase
MAAGDFLKAETQEKVWRYFPRFFWDSLEVTSLFGFGFSKANNNPVLYYHLKNQQDLTTYFKINDTAQRVHSFYQHQDILPNMWVGTAQQIRKNEKRKYSVSDSQEVHSRS